MPTGRRISRVPIDGNEPKELIRFDDPKHPAYRDDFATDGERVYFTTSVLEGAMWVMNVEDGRLR